MPINSIRKGKRIELECSKRLRELGFPDARRGQQYSGTEDSPDVAGVKGAWIDSKARKKIANLMEWMEKADGECGEMTPILFVKGDRWPDFLVVMCIEDWATLWKKGNP
jgi:Holliday junction resolvase